MNIGIIVIGVGILLLIISIFLLIRYFKEDSKISVKEFNEKFERESNLNPARVELGAERKEIAGSLNIHPKFESGEQEIISPEGSYFDSIETEKLNP